MCTLTQNELFDLLLTESNGSIPLALINLDKINEMIKGYKTQITELKAKLKESQDEVKEVKTFNKLLLNELEQKDKKIEKIENEKQQLKNELDNANEEWVILWKRIYHLALPLKRWDRFEIRASMSEYELIKKNNTDVFMYNEFCEMGDVDIDIIFDVKFYANLLCELNSRVIYDINFPVFDTIIRFKDAEGITNICLPQMKDIKDSVKPEALVRLYSLQRLLEIHYKNKGYKIFSYFVLNQSTNEINYPFVRYSNLNLVENEKLYDIYDPYERYEEALNRPMKRCLYKIDDERINKVKEYTNESDIPINLNDVINEYRQTK